MNSQILIKINNFIKNRLIELSGFLLIIVSIFIFLSIITYSGGQDSFIIKSDNPEIDLKNFGGLYGSATADFLLQSMGFIIFLLIFNLFFWGLTLVTEKRIGNFVTKISFTLIYIIFGTVFFSIKDFFSASDWYFYHGSGGFVGNIIRENIYYFTPLIENQYVINGLILLTIVSFILSLSLKLNGILMILLFPLTVVKKILYFLKKKKHKC